MFCPQCGNQIPAKGKFCFRCGASLEIVSPIATPANDSKLMSGSFERTVYTADDQLTVFSDRRLDAESSKVGKGIELRLGEVTEIDGREWIQMILSGGSTKFALFSSVRSHTDASLEAAPSPAAVQSVVAATGTATANAAARSTVSGTPTRAPRKKKSAVFWVWVGVLGVFGLCVLMIVVGVAITAHNVKNGPPTFLSVIGAAKKLPSGNPNFEVVKADTTGNTVTFRDKKTGETLPINFDELKHGKIVLRSNRGLLTFNAGTTLPDWVPVYPGVTPEVKLTMDSADGDVGVATFSTKDLVKSVLSFYEQVLTQAGFKITQNMMSDSEHQFAGSPMGGMIQAQDVGNRRTVTAEAGITAGAVLSGPDHYEAAVTIVFATKK